MLAVCWLAGVAHTTDIPGDLHVVAWPNLRASTGWFRFGTGVGSQGRGCPKNPIGRNRL